VHASGYHSGVDKDERDQTIHMEFKSMSILLIRIIHLILYGKRVANSSGTCNLKWYISNKFLNMPPHPTTSLRSQLVALFGGEYFEAPFVMTMTISQVVLSDLLKSAKIKYFEIIIEPGYPNPQDTIPAQIPVPRDRPSAVTVNNQKQSFQSSIVKTVNLHSSMSLSVRDSRSNMTMNTSRESLTVEVNSSTHSEAKKIEKKHASFTIITDNDTGDKRNGFIQSAIKNTQFFIQSQYKVPSILSITTIAQPLVTTAWLSKNLNAENVVVLDGTWHLPTLKRNARQEFEQIRIKNARFFDIDTVADKNSTLPHMLPTPEEFAKHVGAMGISNDTHVVIYDAVQSIGSAARVLWTFRVFGHNGGVSVLEGGLQKWLAESLETESGPVGEVTPKEYQAKFNPELVKTFDEVRSNLLKPTALIVDSRPAGRFHGQDPEPRAGLPSGHIPKSISLPVSGVVEPPTNTSLPAQLMHGTKLSSALTNAGINISSPTIFSCGSGVNASVAWLATVVARMEVEPGSWEELEDGLSVYDGSWTEWAAREKDGAEIEARGPPVDKN
ncbi:hypothetical protein HDU76_012426, partial [Blyttiomyces sp. JEL0837]